VVLYHLWNRFYPAQTTQERPFVAGSESTGWLFWLTFVCFQFGYTGVQLFFVVSGFCIHYRHARDRNLPIELRDYFTRRARRIYPAYFASLILTSLVLLAPKLILSISRSKPIDWIETGQLDYLLANATFTQQIWPDSLTFNGVYWTLVYEVQFYLVYPLAHWIARRTGWIPLLLIFGAAEAAHFGWGLNLGIPHLFVYRFYEWLLGVVAAELYFRPPSTTGKTLIISCSAACGMTGIVSLFTPSLYPWRDMLLATGYFAAILACGWHSLGSSARNYNRVVRVIPWVGIFSYSLYLVHVPVIDLCWAARSTVIKSGRLPQSVADVVVLVAVPIAFCVGYAFYRLFEKPFLKWKG
jgi:peptidoglycan/LPS O-acetylase OafA/YrhL